MIDLTIRITKQSIKELEKLETILNIWGLKITDKKIDEPTSTLRLSIDVSMPNTSNFMVSIVQSRFQDDLLEYNIRYESE